MILFSILFLYVIVSGYFLYRRWKRGAEKYKDKWWVFRI